MQARQATTGLVLAVILAAGHSAAAGAEPGVIHATWLDTQGAAVDVADLARAECSAVLERAGLDVEWREGSAGEEATAGEVRVILVDSFAVDQGDGEQRFVLGATPPRARRHPVAWIHLGSVRATIGVPPDFPIPHLSPGVRRDLGVAIGRIAAHEIVHVLVPWLEHGDELMSPLLTPDDLTASHLALPPPAVTAVRGALGNGVADSRAEAGVLAAAGAMGGP